MTFPPPDTNNIIDLLPQQLSVTNQKNMRKFRLFSLFYDQVMEYYIRPRIHKAAPERHRSIWRELIGTVQQSKILDLACGTGGLIPCLDKDNDYTGLDLSYEMLIKAERRARKKDFLRYRMVRANAEEVVFVDENFAVIVTDTALHMIPDWRAALASAALALAPEGRLICALPVLGIDKNFDKRWAKFSGCLEVHILTQDDVQGACIENQLEYSFIEQNGGMLYFQAHKK